MNDILFSPVRLNELETLIENSVRKVWEEYEKKYLSNSIHQEKRTLHSIGELAKFLHCSVVTAQKLKNSGKLPCRQFGRKVLFDADEVLKAIKPYNQKKG